MNKKVKCFMGVTMSLMVLLGACGTESQGDTKQKQHDEKIEKVAERSDNEKDNNQNKVEEVVQKKPDNNKKIDVTSLKDKEGKAYEVPSDIKELAGTYAGDNGSGTINDTLNRIEAQINEDGTYTLVNIEISKGLYRNKGTYFDDNNVFNIRDAKEEFRSAKLESGVVAKAYGRHVLVPIQSTINEVLSFNQSGDIDLRMFVNEPTVEDYTISKTFSTIDNGAIVIEGTEITKSTDLKHKEFVSKMVGEWATEYKTNSMGSEIRQFSNLNELYQYTAKERDQDHPAVALTSEELKNIFTEDDKKVDAKFGYKVQSYDSEFVIFDGEKAQTGQYSEGSPLIIEDKNEH